MIEAREEKENMKQEVISGIAAALIDAGMIDTEKFANKVEIAGKVSAIVDKQLGEYTLIKINDAADIVERNTKISNLAAENAMQMTIESLT